MRLTFPAAEIFGLDYSNILELAAILVMACTLIVILDFIVIRRSDRRACVRSMAKIDQMTGDEFEECCAAHFRRLGYKAKITGARGGGDYGVDIILKKNGVVTAVQAKRYKNNVGISAVQQIVAGKAKYGANDALVVTNSHFTQAARELARVNDVVLWDREAIKEVFDAR